MAMRLGVTPTLHWALRIRLRRPPCSASFVRLGAFQLHSKPSFPRIELWRRSVAAISSNSSPSPENEAPRKKRYDLSSGFLQNRRVREPLNLPQEDDGEDWDAEFRSKAPAGRFRDSKGEDSEDEYSWRPPPSKSQSRSSGISQESEEEFGDWTGAAEPSKSFKSSSLYTDVRYNQQGASSTRYAPLPPASGVSNNTRTATRPAHERTNPKPRKQAKESPPSPPSEVVEVVETEMRSGDGASDFIPSVIKPEEPYIYSYTETPKVAPVGFREPVYSPFGPAGVSRPWTGRPPLAKSKKKPREFDSFNPPPVGKKGVKPVQQPGPFLEGEGPKLGRSRDEIMGAPLNDAEIKELIMRAQKEDRQLNLGRDGLTHNMLDLIHQHWKRRRVCKIKCKGVPTVDMDNVCNVLEEKSGGKIILRAGGVVYLFRGRNYNYKTRPIIPLMLWKPPTPIYPKLIERAPAGLTYDEANNLRRLGRKLPPICHLGKNGVYLNLVREVRHAFRVDDLVKVDCKRMNPSDYKKIGAKLKDLVPCVLLSFEHESILMWKGPNAQVDSAPEGVEQDDSGEAVPSFRKELPDGGQELLEQTLTQESTEALVSAEYNGIEEDEDEDEFDDDTDTEEVSLEADHDDFEAALHQDEEQEEDEEEEVEEEEDDGADVESLYNNEGEGEGEVEGEEEEEDEDGAGLWRDSGKSEEQIGIAVEEFESRWEEAISSSEVLILDEHETDPDSVFEVVKSHFGGAYGAPAQARNKRNSNQLVGKKALKNSSQRLDPSVLDRVPKDPSGLLEIDELAKLLAP